MTRLPSAAQVRAATSAMAMPAVLAAIVAMAVAIAAKSWCAGDPSGHGLYLRWCYSDIPPLFHAERLDVGALPYWDHPVEYPVLTGLWMWLAGLLAGTAWSFFAATAVLLAGCAVATAWLLAREVGWPRALVFAAAPTLALSGAVNWDLPAVLFATAGLVAHRRQRDVLSGVMLGLGAAAKLYPGLFLIPVALAAWRRRGLAAGTAVLVAGVGAWWAVNAPVALSATTGWRRFFELSRERPADWDSLLFVARRWFNVDVSVSSANLLTAAAFLVGAAVLIAVAMRLDPPDTWHLVALPLLAWFLLTSKVWSPQFGLWLLPLLALSFPGWAWVAAFAVTDVAVTVTRFPYLANFVGDGVEGAWPYGPFGVAVVVRAALVAAVAVIGWRRAVGSAMPQEVTRALT